MLADVARDRSNAAAGGRARRRRAIRCWRASGRSTVRGAAVSRSSTPTRATPCSASRPAPPLARLRPTGRDDEVEILWWRHGRWGAIGDFGGLRMPLDDALGHIADDPLFWSGA